MSTKRPNVLFIYPDQMRYDCMGNAGNPVLKTPGFDRLAEEGSNFRAAYTSYPLCCPFRASIMTGKYATSHGMMANHYPIPLGQAFLPQLMRENGYNTAWIGKWHLNGGKKYDYVHLFDLEKDPQEMFNLVCQPRQYALIERMHERLAQAMERIGDSWDKEMVFPPPGFQTHEDGAAYAAEQYRNARYEERRAAKEEPAGVL